MFNANGLSRRDHPKRVPRDDLREYSGTRGAVNKHNYFLSYFDPFHSVIRLVLKIFYFPINNEYIFIYSKESSQ